MVSTPGGLVLLGGYVGDELSVATAAVRRLDDGATAWTDDVPLPECARRGRGRVRRHADRLRRRRQAGRRGGRGLRPGPATARGRRIGRLPRRTRAPRRDDGRCRADVRARGARRRARQATSRSSTSSRATSVKTIGELPTKRGGVAAFWWPSLGACLAGGESPGGTNPQVECMDRRRDPVTACPTSASPATGSAPPSSTATAYVVLGGRTAGPVHERHHRVDRAAVSAQQRYAAIGYDFSQ